MGTKIVNGQSNNSINESLLPAFQERRFHFVRKVLKQIDSAWVNKLCFFLDYFSKRPKLRPCCVPSLNLPQRSHSTSVTKKEQRQERNGRLNKRIERREEYLKLQEEKHTNIEQVAGPSDEVESGDAINSCLDDCDSNNNYTEEDRIAASALLELCLPQIPVGNKFFVDDTTQVNSGDFKVSFIELINTDAKLSSLTGIQTLTLLNAIVEICGKYYKPKRRRKVSLKERIVMTFMKLKTGLKYCVISILFDIVTTNTCIKIFHETICLLYKVLQPIILWPSLQDCQRNLPKCFADFQNVRVVLDCTEFQVATPKCLCCRLKTYSHYKSKQTIKFMTGVSPAGLITFISSAYGGRASDKAIFEESGIIKKLEMCVDEIMVDKGFLIKDITDSYGIKVIQPPFLRKKKQFSKEEALLNSKIAMARVHIERCNQRIKAFEVFNKALPWSLVPIINEIFTVVSAIVNLSSPILGDDKFICN